MGLCSFTRMRSENKARTQLLGQVLDSVVEVNESLEPVATKPSGDIPKLTRPRGRKAKKD